MLYCCYILGKFAAGPRVSGPRLLLLNIQTTQRENYSFTVFTQSHEPGPPEPSPLCAGSSRVGFSWACPGRRLRLSSLGVIRLEVEGERQAVTLLFHDICPIIRYKIQAPSSTIHTHIYTSRVSSNHRSRPRQDLSAPLKS
jgi:hypothetical protein